MIRTFPTLSPTLRTNANPLQCTSSINPCGVNEYIKWMNKDVSLRVVRFQACVEYSVAYGAMLSHWHPGVLLGRQGSAMASISTK